MNFSARIAQIKNIRQLIIITFFAISALAYLIHAAYSHFYISTDDAYMNANVVQIAPRITGKVIKLYVSNNQLVQKGQPLFDIDPAPFETAVQSAEAQVATSHAQLTKATLTAERTVQLVKRKYSSPQDGDNVTASLNTAKAALDAANAALTDAKLNLSYTKITSPVTGYITNMSLQEGNIISANQSLFALVSTGEFWVDANFKETEMQSIHSGLAASIVTDLYPNHTYHGIVESISSSAGSAFSLLPPQNATGNWVKVTQRIPVRVRILNPNDHYPIRVGTSATVTIHLQEQIKS